MSTRTKKIPQLPPATGLSGADLFVFSQNDVAKRVNFETIQRKIQLELGSAKDIELRKANGYIQWKYVGDTTWINLIALTDLQGPPGSGGATQSKFTGDGVTKIFNGISGINSLNSLKYSVSVGGVVQEPSVSFTVSLDNGGSLIFDEAPPDGLPITILAFQ
jgi:hypothetical protein